nr:type III PLP-dependent enzyme [Sneathiella limimaris]
MNVYSSAADAIFTEECNDAVHLFYPQKLTEKARLFLDNFPGNCLYAMKSNPHPVVLDHLWDCGIRKFEVASLREIEYITDNFPDAQIYFMHPIKSRQAIRFAYDRGVRNFAFDCLEELIKIEEESGYAEDLNLFLRLGVDQGAAAHPLSGKFGAKLSEAPLLLQRAATHAQKVGVTFHVGSQCMDPQSYRHAIWQVADMLAKASIKIDALDVGGGFPVAYPGMEAGCLLSYFKVIEDALSENGFDDIEIYCEPGRALVAESGSVAVRVEMRKGTSLYLNDGTYGSLFDAGTPAWQYPLDMIDVDDQRLSPVGDEAFRLYGPTCDSLDVMQGPFLLPDDIEEGDWILFHHLGAYGYSMQTRFNGFYSDTAVAILNQ